MIFHQQLEFQKHLAAQQNEFQKRLLQRRIAIFSYLVKQAHLKNKVILTKSMRNLLFDICTFETIKS